MENEKDLTDAELATVMRVSVQTVYTQAKEGGTLNSIKHYFIGRKRLWNYESVKLFREGV